MQVRAYVDTKKVKTISRPYEVKNGQRYNDYFVNIALDDATTVEFKAYLDESRGLYIDTDSSAGGDFTKAFLPQIISVSTIFTATENLEKDITRELGLYREGDAEAMVGIYKYNKEQLHVEIEGKTLAGINQLWDKIRKGNILPYKLQTTTNQEPLIVSADLIQTVDGLRKKLDWAIDELKRADRIIQHSNTLTAEWERLLRERENLIVELRARAQVEMMNQ